MKTVDGIMTIRRVPRRTVSITIRCEDKNRAGGVWRYVCYVMESYLIDGIDLALRKAREHGSFNILIETEDAFELREHSGKEER